MYRIESLLSARLFLCPRSLATGYTFISNLSGRNSLYVMKLGGSVPQPLLPPTSPCKTLTWLRAVPSSFSQIGANSGHDRSGRGRKLPAGFYPN
jgi:hypothetical protein